MMGTVAPETCWAYKKYNKIIIGIYLVFIFQLENFSLPTINFYLIQHTFS